jgi:hypothetical protein
MANDIVADIQKAIVEAVQGQAKEFLEQNTGAKRFLEDRAKRIAQLAGDYALAKTEGDDDEAQKAIGDMEVVKQSILNEITSVTLLATAETRAGFKAALMAGIDILIKALPSIVAAL